MKVLFVNPNVSAAMTTRVLEQARLACPPDWTLRAATASRGVAVVASRASYALAAASALETWAQHEADAADRSDAVVVACFGDPGAAALRELSATAVHGLAEASLRACVHDGYRRIAVLTLGSAWRTLLDELVAACGLDASYAGTFAVEGTGLDALQAPDRTRAALQAGVDAACRADADAIVLGGAALTGWAARLVSAVPLVDCVAATMATVRREAGRFGAPGERADVVAIESVGLPGALASRLRAPRDADAWTR